MSEISLILLPSQKDTFPNMLANHRGYWRLFQAPDPGEPPVTPSTIGEQANSKFYNLMNNNINGVNPVPWASVKGTCMELYDHILSDGVKQILQIAKQDLSPVLQIHSQRQHEWIPWEVLYDGQSFLGLEFQIARMPILPTELELNNDQPHPVQHVLNILGQDVFDGINIGLETTWEATFQGLIPPAKILQKPADIHVNPNWPIVDDLADNRNFDIVHITCHGNMLNNDQERVWALKIGGAAPLFHYIDSVWMSQVKLTPSKSLVFGNACGSNCVADSLSPKFGPEFFNKGALNFIGSIAPLSKALALEFAQQFYQRLLQGNMNIGQALLETKRYFDNQPIAKDPSYLFYCLYGPPTTRFICV